MRKITFALLAATVLASAAPASAQQAAFPSPADDVIVTLGGGVRLQPEFEGSGRYEASPFPIIGLRFMVNPFTGEPTSEFGFGIAPAFRFIGERNAGVDSRLGGLNRIDAAFEAGLNLSYTTSYARGFLEIRQGSGGHDGMLFDVGADAIFLPAPGLKVAVGPRLSFATDDYMSTYFSVSAAEAGASVVGLPAYDAGGGLRSFGAAIRADYDLTPQWLLRFDAAWNRLAGDAGDSPIVTRIGDRDQFTVGIGAAYRFGIDYR